MRHLPRFAPGSASGQSGGGDPPSVSMAATADYIGTMTAELSKIALANRLEMLAYLLDMARMEAEAARHGTARHAARDQ